MNPKFKVDIQETLKRSGLDGVIGKYKVICPLVILYSKLARAKENGNKDVCAAYEEAILLVKGMIEE